MNTLRTVSAGLLLMLGPGGVSGLYNENSVLDSSGLPFSEDTMLTERYTTAKAGISL